MISTIDIPVHRITEQYAAESVTAIRSSLNLTDINIKSIIEIVVEYAKMNYFKLYDARHIALPSCIINKVSSTSYDLYECIKMTEISSQFVELFMQKPIFGDIVLFSKNYVGFIDINTNNIWISMEDRSAPQFITYITIPQTISQHMRDAAYFYNIPYLMRDELNEIQFRCIQLQNNDIWLKQQLQVPPTEQLPSNKKYEINGCGALVVTFNGITKTFLIKGYSTILHINEYFKYSTERRISFKVRCIPDYYNNCTAMDTESDDDTNSDYEDTLPLTWDRKLLLSDGGAYRYEFSAPKSQIISNFHRFEDFIEPFMKKLHKYWEDIYVVVGIVIIYKYGEEENWINIKDIDISGIRFEFDTIMREIFDKSSAWKMQFGADEKIRKKYNMSENDLMHDGWICNIYYGPKCFVKNTMNKLQQFMNSEKHKAMHPWIELIKYELEDPLSEIEGINY